MTRTLSDESIFSNPLFKGCKTVRGSYPAKISGEENLEATRLAEKRQSRLVQSNITSDGGRGGRGYLGDRKRGEEGGKGF